MSLDSLRLFPSNQDLTSPIDKTTSNIFNSQKPCLNTDMDANSQLYKNTNTQMNCTSGGEATVNHQFYATNNQELTDAAKKACEMTIKCPSFKRNNSTTVQAIGNKHEKGSCKVCGDSATGMYFGALVCVPCKTFFLRYAGENIGFRCKQEKMCDIQTSTRTKCKYCRYQKCLFVGMTRRERPSQVHLIEGQQLCVVCLDLANGVHFGAVTCEGCKKFFRRGLTENPSYKCKANRNCVVNPRTRNMCRYCRYQKCLDAGMSREAIQMGRPSKVRYSNDNNRPRSDGAWNAESKNKRHKSNCNTPNLSQSGSSIILENLTHIDNSSHSDENVQRSIFPNNSTSNYNMYDNNAYNNVNSIIKIERRDSPESIVENNSTNLMPFNNLIEIQNADMNNYEEMVCKNEYNNGSLPPRNNQPTEMHNFSAFSNNRDYNYQRSSKNIVYNGGGGSHVFNTVPVPPPPPPQSQQQSNSTTEPANFSGYTQTAIYHHPQHVKSPASYSSNSMPSGSTSPANSLVISPHEAPWPINNSISPPIIHYNHAAENFCIDTGPVTPPLSDWSKNTLSKLVAEAEATTRAQEKVAVNAELIATDPGRIMAKQLQNTIEAKVANLNNKTKVLQPMVVQNIDISGSIADNDMFTPNYWNKQLPDQNVFFTDAHRNIIEKVMTAYSKFVENGAKINKQICSEFKIWTEKNKDVSKFKIPPEFLRIKLVRHYTLSSVNYCESLPGFQDLNDADQYTILRYGQSQSRILVAAQKWYNPKINDFENFFPWKPQPPRPDCKFREDTIEYSRIFRSLDLDAIEESMLNALVLIASDYPGLKQHDIIEKKRAEILEAFTAFTTVKFGTPNNRMQTLFSHIPPLRDIGLFHHRMTFSMVVPD